jgi:hypothetical protein
MKDPAYLRRAGEVMIESLRGGDSKVPTHSEGPASW